MNIQNVETFSPSRPPFCNPSHIYNHIRSKSCYLDREFMLKHRTHFLAWDFNFPTNFLAGKGPDDLYNGEIFVREDMPALLRKYTTSSYSRLTAPDEYISTYTSSLSNFKISDYDVKGRFIRLYNSENKEMEMGKYILQQNYNGKAIIKYQFPPQVKFPPKCTLTVWAGKIPTEAQKNPELNYIFKEEPSWATHIDTVTILCNPSGKAIAWTNPFMQPSMIRFGKALSDRESDMKTADSEPISQQSFTPKIKEVTFSKRKKWDVNMTKFPFGFPPGHKCHPSFKLKHPRDNHFNVLFKLGCSSTQSLNPKSRGKMTLTDPRQLEMKQTS
ncbi:hypothetical protein Ahia01_000413200 [Argonauta hians]